MFSTSATNERRKVSGKGRGFGRKFERLPFLFPMSFILQVSSLTARAANTQNQQLALIQEENKKLISEKTVLQTRVRDRQKSDNNRSNEVR